MIIFANGEIPATAQITLPPGEKVIAADGGAAHCLRRGISPQVVIGDFDSLSEAETAALKAGGAEMIGHPADKDDTDLALALDYALAAGAGEITLYGLLGGRWDMSLANLLLLASPRYAGVRFRVWAGETEAFLLRGGETLCLRGQPGDTLSAIPLAGNARGLSYRGLQWPLETATLPFGTSRGVSNRLLTDEACISLGEGLLLIFLIHGGS